MTKWVSKPLWFFALPLVLLVRVGPASYAASLSDAASWEGVADAYDLQEAALARRLETLTTSNVNQVKDREGFISGVLLGTQLQHFELGQEVLIGKVFSGTLTSRAEDRVSSYLAHAQFLKKRLLRVRAQTQELIDQRNMPSAATLDLERRIQLAQSQVLALRENPEQFEEIRGWFELLRKYEMKLKALDIEKPLPESEVEPKIDNKSLWDRFLDATLYRKEAARHQSKLDTLYADHQKQMNELQQQAVEAVKKINAESIAKISEEITRATENRAQRIQDSIRLTQEEITQIAPYLQNLYWDLFWRGVSEASRTQYLPELNERLNWLDSRLKQIDGAQLRPVCGALLKS